MDNFDGRKRLLLDAERHPEKVLKTSKMKGEKNESC